jgi:hypothetical protein
MSMPQNERVIYILIADGQLVRAYADPELGNKDRAMLIAMKPKSVVAPLAPVKMIDNQALNSGMFQKVNAAW